MQERILLIGNGGREHALARALRRSASCERLWCLPGNPGIAAEATLVAGDPLDGDAIVAFCRDNAVTLVVVGPEQPLEAGVADRCRAAGIRVFGPSRAAAMIESSKQFAKDLMTASGVPTAGYAVFTAQQATEARAWLLARPLPVVIKADGLAAGKGVVIAETYQQAEAALDDMFGGGLGQAGARVVIEDFLVGEEASLFAVTDGERFLVLAPAQDHKRIGDGDTGKNTGGMGAYAPAPLVTDEVRHWAERHVIAPVLAALRERGTPFVGCLYAGLMVHADGTSSVVEFNCRFGDPETQAVMGVIDGDVAALFASAADGALDVATVNDVAAGFACTVVIASGGYPDRFGRGYPITGVDGVAADVVVYHAGTALVDGTLVTAGGRVVGVTGHAPSLELARQRAYAAVEGIVFENRAYRTDIAVRGLARQRSHQPEGGVA